MQFHIAVPREALEEWEWDAIDDGTAGGGSLSLPVKCVASSKSKILDLVDDLDDAAIGLIEVRIDELTSWIATGLPQSVTVRWLGTVSSLVRRSALAAGLLVNTGRLAPTGDER